MNSLELTVRHGEVDRVVDLLWQAGVAGIEERSIDPDTVLLVAGIDPDAMVPLLESIGARWAVRHRHVDEQEYRNTWRSWARAVRIGDRLVVQPPWVDPIAQPGDLVIEIDPGGAWGHGAHPSTMLVLEWLLEDVPTGRRVLDVGCGSGVLAVAAARLGAASVLGIDIDPAALHATLDNAERNGCRDRIVVDGTALEGLRGPFDLIVANIGCSVLREMAPALDALAPGGAIVVSGLIDEQADTVASAFAELARTETARRSTQGWTALVFR